jgi:hypothetical protein
VAEKQKTEERAQLSVHVEQPKPAAVTSVADASPKLRKRVAVLVCHGMGQQVQFETLDTVVRELHRAAERCGTFVPKDQKIGVSLHADAGRFVPRAELNLKLKDKSGSTRAVHFYEAYWAPITEGRVTLRQTLNFFVDAALNGLRFAYRDGVFDRGMFGGREEFEIPARRVLQLGLGLWIIVLIIAGITATGLLPVMTLLDLFQIGSTDAQQIAAVAAAAFSTGIFLGLFGLATVMVAAALGPGPDSQRPKAKINCNVGELAPSKWARRGMALALVLVIVATGVATALLGIWWYGSWILPAVTDPGAHWVGFVSGVLLFLAEVLLFRRFIKNFVVEFGGDVAAYLSPYKVSIFEEIRHAIQDRGRQVARFIYSARESGSLLYDEVFIVGHSLGSVLAYDTLNDAIKRDTHENGWGPDAPATGSRVVDRTRLLLTFGSPLDKTAFVFRTQKMELEIDVREALAGAQQPLIQSYEMRRAKWINLWSPSDWISGPLGYYDAPAPDPPLGRGVCNIENPGSWRPDQAHTGYWEGPLVRAVIHTALTGICPDDVPEPQRSQIVKCYVEQPKQ